MARTDTEAHVRVFQSDASMMPLSPDAWESLETALEGGAVWWKGTTLHGASVMIRCSSIADIHFMTADVLASIRADNDNAEWATS
jgi:hypothetical protein